MLCFTLPVGSHTFSSNESSTLTQAAVKKVIKFKVPIFFQKRGSDIVFKHVKRIRSKRAYDLAWVHYSKTTSISTQDVKSMRKGCSPMFNLSKRGASLVPTKSYMGHNHEVNANESDHCRKILQLDAKIWIKHF